jgi:hypothetical protein
MDADLYDEFGNYIGPDLESESEEEEFEEQDQDVSLMIFLNFQHVYELQFVYLGRWNRR